MKKFEDYPKERINATDTNEAAVCFFCKTLVNEIQGDLKKHKSDCKYRLQKEKIN